MRRKFYGVFVSVLAIQLFQSLSNAGVQAHLSSRGQLTGQRLLDQSVGELVVANFVR